ncbi:MAG: transposase [Chloroflexota bacterium]
MLRGETTKRSPLDPDTLTATLQAHGVDRLRGEATIWVVLDGSDLRKPYATAMESLQRVKRLAGKGTVPGYCTLNAIGIGPAKRGLLYHRLFSSQAPDFISESAEERMAIASVAEALAPLGAEVTWILDAGFDDVARWGDMWEQGHHLLCRLQHRDRWVETPDGAACQLQDLVPRLVPLAQVTTELVVQKRGQPRPKLQPATAIVSATPLAVRWRPGLRTMAEREEQRQACWLVEVRLDRVDQESWWLLTDRPVETAEQASEVFRMYCQRWAIEDAFKVAKTCLGWEDVQVLAYEAVRLLVALGWVAAGFLFDLGVTLDWREVRLLRRLGGGEDRPNRPPGKIVLTRGLRRLLDHLAMEAILAAEDREHGGLPPRLAAMLGRTPVQ